MIQHWHNVHIKKTDIAKIIVLVSFCLAALSLSAQEYEPQILILAPNEANYEKSFEKELRKINSDMQQSLDAGQRKEYQESEEFNSQPENIKLMMMSELRYSEKRDFFRQVSYFAFQYLSYRFFERFPNQLILLSSSTAKGNAEELKALANKEKTHYILNFPNIELYKSRGVAYAKIKVQLYDSNTGEYLINEDFQGDWRNPGFEFACRDKTIHCTINNALSAALAEVIQQVAYNSPTLQRERQLAQRRHEELMVNHFPKHCDIEPLKQIIGADTEEFPLDNIYQVIYDQTMTKFVAFSVEETTGQKFKDLTEQKKDKNVSIITNNDIKSGGFPSEIPQTYAFIITGVKHDGSWYYEKSNVTYFEAESIEDGRKKYFNNLQKWNFFIDNSTMASPNFWETELFEKVPDLKKDPDWKKYGESIWKTDEANNREYVGMYEIVANVLRRRDQEENERFEKGMKENLLLSIYEELKSSKPTEYAKYSDHSLIYASDRKVVISPVLITNDKGVSVIRYFIAFADSKEVFEWTYFAPQQVEGSSHFGSTVVDSMNTITEWNFSYDFLNDEEFWKKYVLHEQDGEFEYLRKVVF